MLTILFLSPLISALSKKLAPPTSDPKPKCNRKVCSKTRVWAKVYIDDLLWEQYISWNKRQRGHVDLSLEQRVSRVVDGINSHLARLDNGGFEVVIAGHVNKISQSDVRLGDTYVDRVDKNKTKKFSVQDVVAQTFAFQEAVFKLPTPLKHEVNLRILFMKETRPYTLQGTAEEMCICDQHPVFNFGCVAIFAIRHLDQWTFHTSIFAHELGHALGAAEHDDKYYRHSSGDRLIMWSKVGLTTFCQHLLVFLQGGSESQHLVASGKNFDCFNKPLLSEQSRS